MKKLGFGFAATILTCISGLVNSNVSLAQSEWRTVAPKERKIVFSAPGLEIRDARITVKVADSSAGRSEWICWFKFRDKNANACITYQTTGGNGFGYVRASDVSGILSPSFSKVEYRNRGSVFEMISAVGNLELILGEVTYPIKKECVLFSGSFDGNFSWLAGWYCSEVGKPLTQETIGTIVSSVGIRGGGAPDDLAITGDMSEVERRVVRALNDAQHSEAFRSAKSVAHQGNADGQYLFAVMHLFGKGMPIDSVKARVWFRRAAMQGHDHAYNALIEFAKLGKIRPLNSSEKFELVRQGSELGLSLAQNDLANMYYSGTQVEKDEVLAYMWWSLSATQGDKKGKKGKESVIKILSSEEIVLGDQLAKACASRNFKNCGRR
jgi:hypothetical protein